jgi:hypothetical protein
MRCQRPYARIRPSGAAFAFGLLACLLPAERAGAQGPFGPQLPAPRLLVVSPCGGQVGSSFEATLTGLNLEQPDGLLFSQPGLKAELLGTAPQPRPDPRKKPPQRRRFGQLGQPTTARFKITIAPDTPIGIHDVRLFNRWGVSNPRAFVVGDLKEVAEKEPNNDVAQAQRVELNSTVNGTIASATDVDYYVFAGKKGQRVVLSCLASSIDSRLHAALELYDSTGTWLGENRDYSGKDALLDCTLPDDGDYTVRAFQFTYMQGSPEFFYRLSISTTPWIDAIFPCVVEPGKPAQVTVFGRNLPGGKPDSEAVVDGRVLEKMTVTVDVPRGPRTLQRLAYSGRVPPASSGLDGFEYRVSNPSGSSNPFLLTYATAPVVLDNGDNDTPETAQAVTVPCEIAGRIEKRRDRDWYAFKAKKGDVYSIEAYGERLGSQTDLYFRLRNAKTGQNMGEFDDNQETLALVKFFTRTGDPPRYRFVAPADGTYWLMVSSRDADSRGSPRDLYRVRITPAQPDFRLVVMPASDNSPEACVVRQGGNQYYDVMAWRQDGWNGDIRLTIEGLPEGVTCLPQVVGTGLQHAALVVSAAADAPIWSGEVKVKGEATINGRSVVREARPASITWPVQPGLPFPAVSRLDRNLMLAVREKAPFNLTAALDKPAVLQGTKAAIKVKLARLWPDFKGPLQVFVERPGQRPAFLPQNVTVNGNRPLPLSGDKNEATLLVDVRPNAPPGTYTIVLRGFAQVPYNRDPKSKQKQNAIAMQPATPVTLTVLPRQVARLALSSTSPSVRTGKQTEIRVRVARMYDFAGEFKVRLILPPNAKGITADEIVIPAGKNEARLVLEADDDADPGTRSNLIVRATALVNGTVPTSQDVKINVKVVK